MKDIAVMPGRLAAFLGHREGGRTATVERYELMTGGYSRVMAKADVLWDDGSAETVVLRGDPPAGEAMLDTDRDAEWNVLQALTQMGTIPMPAARYYDATAEHLGTKCIVLECAPGSSLCSVIRDADDPLSYRDRFVDSLAAVHAVELDRLPATMGRPTDWDDYLDATNALWAETEGTLADSNPFFRYVGAWLNANRPPPMDLALCHGDFQASNIMVDPCGSLQVIDWEYAHIGDPREDLGWYVVYTKSSPPSLYDPEPEAFLARYRDQTGASELQVNQATVGYFALVSTVKIFGQILRAASALYLGDRASLVTLYNLNAAAVGHMNLISGCAELAGPMAALREAATIVAKAS
jgi:aminoglycoside phosphotransferase (APT) family kinase protein